MRKNHRHMNNTTKLPNHFLSLVVAAVVLAVAITGCIDNPPENTDTNDFSFDEDMQGWEKDGTDLDDPPIEWTVEQTTNKSYNGSGSVKLYLNNLNDAGKIWMERSFDVEPNTMYEVTVSYFFGTADYGEFNLFNIICGVTTTNPETIDDLTFQGDTGHHQDEQDEYLWLEKEYTFTVLSDDNGALYVSIGVWGNWETPRTYYVDEVNISFNALSVEDFPDLSGNWQIFYHDWTGNVTKSDNVSITQDNYTVILFNDTATLGQGILLQNNQLPPFNTTDFIISGLDFGGLGIDTIYVHNETYLKTELPLCENCNPAVLTRR